MSYQIVLKHFSVLFLNYKSSRFVDSKQFFSNHCRMKAFHWAPFFGAVIFCVYYSSASSKYEITLERFEGAFGDEDKLLNLDGLRIKKFNRTS
jgi:hypothetical protein